MSKTVTLTCTACSIHFKKDKSNYQRLFARKRRMFPTQNAKEYKWFCCTKCRVNNQTKSIDLKCTRCGTAVLKIPSEIKKVDNVFCSQSCSALHNNPKRRKVRQCIICKEVITSMSGLLYCSRSCQKHNNAIKMNLKFLKGELSCRKTLRRAMLHNSIPYKCAVCNLDTWQNKKITLQLDHIDGNAGNNLPANLRFLCPNCHCQTPTWGGYNRGNGRRSRGIYPF